MTTSSDFPCLHCGAPLSALCKVRPCCAHCAHPIKSEKPMTTPTDPRADAMTNEELEALVAEAQAWKWLQAYGFGQSEPTETQVLVRRLLAAVEALRADRDQALSVLCPWCLGKARAHYFLQGPVECSYCEATGRVPEARVIQMLEANRDALRRELEAVREDSERLDWLESRRHANRAWTCSKIGPPDLTTEACEGRLPPHLFFRARSAIDAARAAAEKEERDDAV